MKLGHVRLSTIDQNASMQKAALTAARAAGVMLGTC
jgi:DNA invertase Pin-like site-specific DNA recombinase